MVCKRRNESSQKQMLRQMILVILEEVLDRGLEYLRYDYRNIDIKNIRNDLAKNYKPTI